MNFLHKQNKSIAPFYIHNNILKSYLPLPRPWDLMRNLPLPQYHPLRGLFLELWLYLMGHRQQVALLLLGTDFVVVYCKLVLGIEPVGVVLQNNIFTIAGIFLWFQALF